MLRNDQLAEWDRENFFHPSTHLAQFARGEAHDRIMTGGKGVHIEDREGNRLLDGFAGLYCVNVGYGRQEIAEAIARQAKELAYYHAYVGHGTEASITLAKMILDRAPEGMSKVYFGLGGSDANETNVKLVWHYNNILGRPEKKKIISRWRGYHGSGLMTGSLTGLELYHKKFDLPLPQVKHTEAPDYFRRPELSMGEEEFVAYCAAKLEEMILAEGPDTVAAFIGEPALGTGGIVPPPAGYWEAIQKVLAKYDVLLIADEVVTGFGRLGTMFGSDHYGLKPDIITIAKGLTSAYAPLSGSIIGDEDVGSPDARHGRERADRPWLDLLGASDRSGRGCRQPGTDRQARPRRERRQGRRDAEPADEGGRRRPPPCRRRARRGHAVRRRVRRGPRQAAPSSTRRRRSVPPSPPRCSSGASSDAPCRRATSSASRRPSA